MDSDAAHRRRIVLIAGHTGDGATVRAHQEDPDPTVRQAAISSLHRLGELRCKDLTCALSDPVPAVRRRALEIIAALHGEGPAELVSVLGLLSDPDDTVVETAAWACGELTATPPGTVDELIALTTGADDALVRESAVAALGAIGDPIALPAILAATEDKATVRRRAVLALAPFEGPEVNEALRRCLADRDWQVRQAAEDLWDPPH
ncbi:MAG: HEAT repeat domain-containing protein [Acidimicrobiales bacterium]|nr:HEAT repeat domain-containing protein [Acidimicrobiales bacterium]